VTLPVAEQGFEVVGIDMHGPSIEDARAHSTLANVKFVVGDFRNAPQLGDFHAVILSDVLEHVRDPETMLEVASAALRPDGIFLVSIPNGYGPYEIEQFLIRAGILRLPLALVRRGVQGGVRVKQALRGAPPPDPEPPAYNVDSPHVQHFTLGRFRRLLQSKGFRIERRRNGAWFGGDLTYFLFYFAPRLVPASLRVADALPARLASTWYFECRRGDAGRAPVS
jgi:SAM-dependent methyltransferase